MYHVSIAQSAEQQTLNLWVLGSSPSGDTKKESKVGLGLPFNYSRDWFLSFFLKLQRFQKHLTKISILMITLGYRLKINIESWKR